MIACYAIVQNNLMKVCFIVNSLYAVVDVVFLGMIIKSQLM